MILERSRSLSSSRFVDKGFGFIEGERRELFFRRSEVKGTPFESLREGQAVSYTEGRGPKGPRAEAITVVG